MKKLKRPFWILCTLFVLFVVAPAALAHPLGNFSISHYSRLDVGLEQIGLLYVVDMAEIPTFQERPFLDTNHDDAISAAEQETYADQLINQLTSNLHLSINGEPVALIPQSHSLTFPPGQGELPTTRLEIRYTAVLPSGSDLWQAEYRDDNFSDRIGWQEVIVMGNDRINLLASSAPAQDVSNALRSYPADLLESPPAINSATFRFEAAGVTGQAGSSGITSTLPETTQSLPGRFSPDRSADLLATALDTPGALVLALLAAAGLGAAHALTPGHGKTIVGAYLVASRCTARHALFLGLTTTITHTAGIFIFGLIVLFASRFILPDQLYPWLGVASGLLVVSMGASLFRSRLNGLFPANSHGENHGQETGFHYHTGGFGHTHTPPDSDIGWRSLIALGVSGGLIPCPSALVLLLSAVALDKVVLGLILILFFSLGLASVLTGIGLAMVYAGQLFKKVPGNEDGRFRQVAPALSALFITLAGLAITYQAILQTRAWH